MTFSAVREGRTSSLRIQTPQDPARIDGWIDELAIDIEEPPIPWEQLRNRPLTLREKQVLRLHYSGAYPIQSRYTEDHPFHKDVALWRLAMAKIVFGELGRVLDAGCAAGEFVRMARQNDIEAFGFDLCPDLFEVCYPEVADHLRIGTLAHVPYSAADGFKTLVSFDVIEHVPIDDLRRFPGELRRLGIRQIACIISTDTISAGHITIQDTDWYRELFASAGFRMLDELTEALAETESPVAWLEEERQIIWGPYNQWGKPVNGWNQAPGFLFFRLED